MYLKSLVYAITFLLVAETNCFKGMLSSSGFSIADYQSNQENREQFEARLDSPPVDAQQLGEEDRQRRIDYNRQQIDIFYEQQAQITPEQLLENIKNAKKQLRRLRQVNAQSFAVHFFRDINCFPEMLCFYAQLKYYQDVINLLLQECLLPDDKSQQMIAARLKEFLFGQDPGRGCFGYDREVALFLGAVRRRLQQDQQLCNRIDNMLTARGVSPDVCLWSENSPEQQAYCTYLIESLADYTAPTCVIS